MYYLEIEWQQVLFSETSKSILFCKEGTAYDEKWEGSRIGET